MPELTFTLRWPDGTQQTCYSPSTIIRDHFVSNTEYLLTEFLERSRAALCAASERVRARYGTPCSLALGQLTQIETAATRFASETNVYVMFESFKE